MPARLPAGVAIAFLGAALAATSATAASPQYDWSGFFAGVTAGAAVGQYDVQTSTVGDGYMNAVQASAVTATGRQTIRPLGFTAGIEGGFNWQVGNALFGLEADFQAVHLNGGAGSGAVAYPVAPAGAAFTVTSYGNANWLFTARPRIGLVAPNHWLFYATGGLAVTQLQADFSFVDNFAPVLESGKLDTVKAGYAVGGGIEAPLTRHLSLKADYLHVRFASTPVGSASNDLTPFFPAQIFSHAAGLQADVVRAGLNYRFGMGSDPAASAVAPFKLPYWNTASPLLTGWTLETGARLWLGSGMVGAPQPLIDVPPPTLASRLTFGGLDAIAGETFARADHDSGVFVKGYLGAGSINRGALNDEDFSSGTTVYSNTLSNASGHLGYATIDLGYNLVQTPAARIGPFVGYNYYNEAINVYGCNQLGGSTTCAPALPGPLFVLTENDQLSSLRLGAVGELNLTDRLRLTAEAAYVPWVNFAGLDNHLLRQFLLPESATTGDGVMLEAVLDYLIASGWSVGLGARYWAWNFNTGTTTFQLLAPPASFSETGRYNVERYGLFVQSSYRWNDPLPHGASPRLFNDASASASAVPMNWTGFHAGMHLGGGWSDVSWSDPFGSMIGAGGLINVAGFGDQTHATGPLGGGGIGADWQSGHVVIGLAADLSAADIRGENTCFSGVGGINCQHILDALATFTARTGYAWDRWLAYVKGGGALTQTGYNLFGNTFALALGSGGATINAWGWTVGGGIEYALTDDWTTFVEYNHIGLPAVTASFANVATVNTQTIRVRENADLFKLGVNYKFELADASTLASAIAKRAQPPYP